MNKFDDAINEFRVKIDNLYEDEDIFELKVAFTESFKCVLSSASVGERMEIINAYLNELLDSSGCQVDYEQLDTIIERLMSERILTDKEIKYGLNGKGFGRWS